MSSPAISSTPILRKTLLWATLVTAVLAVVGAVVGYLLEGVTGLWSALAGILLAAVFLGITGASILIANRWFGDPLYLPIFFGIVLGGWILKLILFVVALLVLRGQPWIDPVIFFVAVVVSILASLIVDVVVVARMRVPTTEVTLPQENPEDVSSPERDTSADRTGADS